MDGAGAPVLDHVPAMALHDNFAAATTRPCVRVLHMVVNWWGGATAF